MRKNKFLALLLSGVMILSGAALLSGCAGQSGGEDDDSDGVTLQGSIDVENMFTDRDMEIGYDEAASVKIQLSDDTASCSSDAVEISGGTVTIRDEGTYILSGSLSDGRIVVDVDDADKVQLVLDGVDIVSADSAAVYVLSADKVFITTASGSENTLANGGEYAAIDDNNIDAVIF